MVCILLLVDGLCVVVNGLYVVVGRWLLLVCVLLLDGLYVVRWSVCCCC